MYDIDKILEKFESDLKGKTLEEKIAFLKGYGFQIKSEEEEKIKERQL